MGSLAVLVIISAFGMFISSLPLCCLVVHYRVLNNTGLIVGPVRVTVRKVAEKEKRGREKKRACLVQKPFNNFPWKLKEEIVLGWIAVGGNEAHMKTR